METTRLVSSGSNAADIFNEDNTYFSWSPITKLREIFNPEWLENLYDTVPDFSPNWVAVVYRRAKYNNKNESTAHIDFNPREKKYFYYGLNFTVDQDDSEMVWYERLDGKIDLEDRSSFFDVNHSQLKEIYRANIPSDRLTLVNTSVFHDVDNKGKDRWALSIRGFTSKTICSWDDAVTFFTPWINKPSTPTG